MKREEAFFGIHFDLHPDKEDTCLGADIKDDNIKDFLERVRPEYVTYDCKGHVGYSGYQSKIGTPSPGIIKDSLEIWRRLTKEYGILLGIHYSGVVDNVAIENHPEWACVNSDGEINKEATSTFREYATNYMIPQLIEVCKAYDIDYVWLDGECWGTKLDYCDEAVKAWFNETGYTDVPKDRNDNRWLEWKKFNRNQFEKYLCNWVDELHKFKSTLCCTSNWAYTTMMPIPKKANINMISGDFDPFLSVDRARTECRYLQNTDMPWELMAWGFDLVKDQDECAKLPAQLKQEASVVMMHGGAFMVYYIPSRSGYIDEQIISTSADVAEFCRERKDFCFKSTVIPQVALLYSSETQLDRSDNVYTWWGALLQELEGALHALLELHYSVDILSEHQLQLNNRLNDFPLLVIPDSYKLSESFCEQVKNYVYGGGKLLLLGEKCAKHFKDILGVEFIDEPENINTIVKTKSGKISARGVWQKIDVKTATTLGYRYSADGCQKRSSFIDIRDEGVSDIAAKNIHRDIAATKNNYGKGQVAAIYGPLCQLYFDNHHPFTREFIGNVVSEIFSEPLVKIDAPSCIEISLRRSLKGDITINLLNLSNMPISERRAYNDFVPSVGPIILELQCKTAPKEVMLEPDGIDLEWNWENGKLYTTVDKLQIHGVVVVK